MSKRTKRRRGGVVLIAVAAACAVAGVAVYLLFPFFLQADEVQAAEPVAELSGSGDDVPDEVQADVSEETQADEEEGSVLLPSALFEGWDTAALDAFCAEQPGGFSVYAQDLETGAVYTYNTDTEYYPASVLKAAYALWLCQLAEQGMLDLEGMVDNLFSAGTLDGTKLDAYDGCAVIPAWDVMYAMISVSDNNALEILEATWPGDSQNGFCDYLSELGFHAPYSCALTIDSGINGVMNINDAGLLMQALYAYFETGTSTALQLMDCFLDAEHTALYIPEGVQAAKKYGSWDYAFHDLAIVYAERPYILCCMTDQGDQNIDFPSDVVAAMQELGLLVYTQESA